MLFKSIREIARKNTERFLKNLEERKTKKEKTSAQNEARKEDEASVCEPSQTKEFFEVLRIFHEHPTQWISALDIMSETQYQLTVVYPILTWMMGAGLLGIWVFDGARSVYTLNEKALAYVSDMLERKNMIQKDVESA